jgi:pyrroloquinoline-quinone synthase
MRRVLAWPEVRQFNTTLVGPAVMGIIERMFSRISAWVGQGIVHNGWLTNEKMVHYNLHEELDIKHSQDFFNIIEPKYDDPEERYYIEQGLRLGAHTFNALYEGLYAARKRRDFRETRGLHSRA